MLKRTFDIVLSTGGILALLPLFPFVAIAIRIDSSGPIFYLQDRAGRNGRIFRIIKFRSMVVGADRQSNHAGPADSRVTRIGSILRRTKFDEMPTLVNVLKGDMSFVGPRPPLPQDLVYYTSEQRHVLSVRPGITDLATLQFDDEIRLMEGVDRVDEFYVEQILPAKLSLNLEYIRRRSFWFDLRIIFATLFLMIRRKG